jgi:cellulose synthase operon protein C
MRKLVLIISTTILFFALSPLGYAQKRTKTIGDILNKIEKKSVNLKVQKSQSSLPTIQKEEAIVKRDLREVKPPSSNKLYFSEDENEAELEKITDQGIDQLYKLTQRYKRSSRRGELWLRLAELYVDKARLIEFRLQNDYDKKMDEFLTKKRKAKPKLDLEPAFVYNRKAIQLYEWFVRDFPKDPKMDQALFFLGYNHFELNQVKMGEAFYVRLTKEYPKSQYVHESNFALGEYHFDNERWKPAYEYYSRVAGDKRHRLHGFSLFKLAWCAYKLNETKKALSYLEQVIMLGRKSKAQESQSANNVSRIRLAKEAIKDLVVFYAEAGDYKKARPYFEDVVGVNSAPGALVKMATYYMDTGNYPAARYMFREFIELEPDSPKAFDYQSNIVKMTQAAGPSSDEFRKELFSWVQDYGPSSDWQKKNADQEETRNRANETIEFTLRNYVLAQHQSAQNARTKGTQARAREGYDLYLSGFKKSPKLDEMQFFYGELLFDIGDYLEAAVHYEWVIENAPRSKYFDKSLLNSLLNCPRLRKSKRLWEKTVQSKSNFQKMWKRFERRRFVI